MSPNEVKLDFSVTDDGALMIVSIVQAGLDPVYFSFGDPGMAAYFARQLMRAAERMVNIRSALAAEMLQEAEHILEGAS